MTCKLFRQNPHSIQTAPNRPPRPLLPTSKPIESRDNLSSTV
ncbi:hypothetical protein ACFXDF_47255 [Streptomyces sp. NPDC059426]